MIDYEMLSARSWSSLYDVMEIFIRIVPPDHPGLTKADLTVLLEADRVLNGEDHKYDPV